MVKLVGRRKKKKKIEIVCHAEEISDWISRKSAKCPNKSQSTKAKLVIECKKKERW